MKKSIKTTLATLVLIAPIGSILAAQDTPATPAAEKADALPTPKQITDLMVEFGGGAKAFKDPMPIKSTGTFSVPQAQMTGSMTTWSSPPNLMRVDIEIPGLGITKTGFNGKVGWTLDPARGPSLMEGAMLEEIKREADPASGLDLLKAFDVAKVTGRETFEGVDCVVLKLQKGETIQERFVDEKTGRLVGMRSKMPTPMGEIPATTVIKSWITIGPRKVPSETVIKMMGMEQVMKIDKVMTEPIDPEVFALPPAIKALAQARDAEKKTTPDSAGDSSSEKAPSSSSGEGR